MSSNKKLLKNLLKRKAIRGYNEAVGGLGLPSKMPGYAYGISATQCVTGRKLAKVPGSICAGCYAMKANYRYPSVMTAHEKRQASLQDLEAWTRNMIDLLGELARTVPDEERYFRFHDSGDLQSVEHLDAIVRVATDRPEWRFWLPTRERGMVRKYRERGDFPRNLVVRMSEHMVGSAPTRNDLPSSTVSWDDSTLDCPARSQGNECGTCRACWEPEVANVNYALH